MGISFTNALVDAHGLNLFVKDWSLVRMVRSSVVEGHPLHIWDSVFEPLQLDAYVPGDIDS